MDSQPAQAGLVTRDPFPYSSDHQFSPYLGKNFISQELRPVNEEKSAEF